MKRERYVIILPMAVFSVVGLGFILGAVFPRLSSAFFFYVALGAGAVILGIDRIARRRVTEAVTDERLRAIGGEAALLAYRVTIAVVCIAAIGATAIFRTPDAVRFIGVGAAAAVGLQGLIYFIVYVSLKSGR